MDYFYFSEFGNRAFTTACSKSSETSSVFAAAAESRFETGAGSEREVDAGVAASHFARRCRYQQNSPGTEP